MKRGAEGGVEAEAQREVGAEGQCEATAQAEGARTSSAPETRFCCVKKLSIESPPGACSRALCTRNLATWRGARVGRAQGWGWGWS